MELAGICGGNDLGSHVASSGRGTSACSRASPEADCIWPAGRSDLRGAVVAEIRMDGRVAVVTGAGSGLGRCHALLLAERGARVVVNDLLAAPTAERPGADAVVEEIRAAGGTAVADTSSVATRDGAAALVNTAIDAFGTVDALVNNAGILRTTTFETLDEDTLDELFAVHVKGSLFVTQAAYPIMREKGFGRIVFTASSAGMLGMPDAPGYSIAKAAVLGLARSLALSSAGDGVLVNVLCPYAMTPMARGSGRPASPDSERMRPEDVSPVVAYLCSDACTVNKEVFVVGYGGIAQYRTVTTTPWFPPSGSPTPEHVRDNLDAIHDMTGALEHWSIETEAPSRMPARA